MRRPFLLASCVTLFLVVAPRVGTARASDPTTADCLGASERSLTLRNEHKLRDARAQLLICAAASCPTDVRDECIRRVGEVNVAIPTIVFETKDAVGNDMVAVSVTMDGQLIAQRLEGIALSIDPGAHSFSFETKGRFVVQKQFVIREGEKDRRERIVFGAINATAPNASRPPTAPPVSVVAQTVVPRKPPSGGSSGLGAQRISAMAAAGVGVVSLAVGVVYGLQAMSKHNDANQACPDKVCPDQKGVDLWNDAVSAGRVSTAGFVVGAVGLAAGATLWLTSKPQEDGGREASVVQVGLGIGLVQMKGTW